MKTRFAPSPTGFMHIGSLRTALYSYLWAKKEGGTFLIRIEDTDRSRFVEGSEEDLMTSLAACGIGFDEGPYTQSERTEIYREHCDRLVTEGNAYPCFCTSERLDQMRSDQQAAKRPPMYDRTCSRLGADEVASRIESGESYVIRLKINKEKTYRFHDEIRGDMEFKGETIDDQVLLKSDGMPTYHLACVVDDHLMDITHVMRGEEWLPSAPKHVALYECFGWNHPVYAHIPLLMNKGGGKMSKREGDVAFGSFLKKGYLPSALVNFISLLGWNPGDEQEMFSLSDLEATFDVDRIHKSGAVFDYEKLDWMNGKYIRSLDLDELVSLVRPRLIEAEMIDESYDSDKLKKYVGELQDRFVTLGEAPELMHYFFKEASDLEYNPSIIAFKKQELVDAKCALEIALSRLTIEDHWNRDHLNDVLRALALENDLKPGMLLWPIRVALTGEEKSPGTFELLEVFGKDESLLRIKDAISRI